MVTAPSCPTSIQALGLKGAGAGAGRGSNAGRYSPMSRVAPAAAPVLRNSRRSTVVWFMSHLLPSGARSIRSTYEGCPDRVNKRGRGPQYGRLVSLKGEPWPPDPVRHPEAQTHLLADYDGAGHRGAMHRAMVLIGARRRERDGVRLAVAAHDRTARERGRSLGLDAVGDAQVVGPRPRHGATHRHRVDRRVRGSPVDAV